MAPKSGRGLSILLVRECELSKVAEPAPRFNQGSRAHALLGGPHCRCLISSRPTLETTQTPVSRGWTKKPGCVGEGLMPHGKAQQAAGTLGQTEPCGCRVAERCHLWRSSCQVTWPCAKVSSPAEGIAGDRVTGGGDC